MVDVVVVYYLKLERIWSAVSIETTYIMKLVMKMDYLANIIAHDNARIQNLIPVNLISLTPNTAYHV
jgi:hypothetical protein